MLRRALLLALPSAARAIDTRQPAPRFRAKTISGESFDNDSLFGRPVLIQCWATWCRYCRQDQPAVEALLREFAPQRLLVLAVNVGESRRRVTDYLQSAPRASKIVLTLDTNLAALYGNLGLPFYLMLDTNGKIVDTQAGAAGEDPLRNLIKRALP